MQRNLQLLIITAAAAYLCVAGGYQGLHQGKDFVPIYTGASCLLKGCNPYNPSQLEAQFLLNGGLAEQNVNWNDAVPVYPPSTFLVLSPLALLRFPASRVLWVVLNGSLFVAAVILVLSVCPDSHRWLTTGMVSLFLVSSRTPLAVGQPAILAISCLVMGTILFILGRYIPLAAFLLMVSLAVKPQIGGLVVFYFLFRKIHWREAALACAGALILLVAGALILWQRPASTNWLSDLRANIAGSLRPGAINDPRPANPEAVGDVNLQAITSIFFTDERIFDAAAWGIILVLLCAWGVIVLRRANLLPVNHYAALAALAILSLLPVYHRSYDTRLLVVTVPAIPLILSESRVLGTFATILTPLAFLPFFQYRVQVFLQSHSALQKLLQDKLLFMLLARNEILALVLLFFIYLAAIPLNSCAARAVTFNGRR